MRLFVITDNRDTLVGMRLAGTKGAMVNTKDEALEVLEGLLSEGETGIILITEKVAEQIRERVDYIKIKMSVPLIVEIPDRKGSIKDKNYIMNYVKESIGIKI